MGRLIKYPGDSLKLFWKLSNFEEDHHNTPQIVVIYWGKIFMSVSSEMDSEE